MLWLCFNASGFCGPDTLKKVVPVWRLKQQKSGLYFKCAPCPKHLKETESCEDTLDISRTGGETWAVIRDFTAQLLHIPKVMHSHCITLMTCSTVCETDLVHYNSDIIIMQKKSFLFPNIYQSAQ